MPSKQPVCLVQMMFFVDFLLLRHCVLVFSFSDLPSVVSVWPYFWPADIPHADDGVHLVVCVHGLDGQSLSL